MLCAGGLLHKQLRASDSGDMCLFIDPCTYSGEPFTDTEQWCDLDLCKFQLIGILVEIEKRKCY